MRYPEPPGCFGAVDRIGAAEASAGNERVEALTVLPRYRFNILSDGIQQREARLCINSVSKSVPMLPKEPAINSRPRGRDVVDGVVALRDELRKPRVSMPDIGSPGL
jgi:hypothetical protein